MASPWARRRRRAGALVRRRAPSGLDSRTLRQHRLRAVQRLDRDFSSTHNEDRLWPPSCTDPPRRAPSRNRRSVADKLEGFRTLRLGSRAGARRLKPSRSETPACLHRPAVRPEAWRLWVCSPQVATTRPTNVVVILRGDPSRSGASSTQPMLPLRPGQAARGTAPSTNATATTWTLFAALGKATGNVIGKCFARHARSSSDSSSMRSAETSHAQLRCSHHRRQLTRRTRAPTIARWLANNPEVPSSTSSPPTRSWLNQGKVGSRILTTKR